MRIETRKMLDELNSFKNFERNWDGYDARPLPQNSLEYCEAFIHFLVHEDEEDFLKDLEINPYPGGIDIATSTEATPYFEIQFLNKEFGLFFYKNKELGIQSRSFKILYSRAYNLQGVFRSAVDECKMNIKCIELLKKENLKNV